MRKFKGFHSRIDAGRELAINFAPEYRNRPDVVVLFVSPNCAPIAHEVTRGLQASTMDVFLTKDVSVPGSNGARMGVVSSGGLRSVDANSVASLGIDSGWANSHVQQELVLLEKEESYFRGQRPAIPLQGKTVIVVDDGFTPVSVLLDAIRGMRQAKPMKVILALPIVTPAHTRDLSNMVDLIAGVEETTDEETNLAWYGPFQEVSRQQVRLHLMMWRPHEQIAA